MIILEADVNVSYTFVSSSEFFYSLETMIIFIVE